MPIGNIDPRNDSFTRTSMLLGPEEYPSTTQQAEGGNSGYLLYKPFIGHNSYGGTAVSAAAGTTTTELGKIYLVAGKYDIELEFSTDSFVSSGVAWLKIGSVFVSSEHTITTAGSTVIESFAGVTLTAGWHSLYASAYNGETTEIYNVYSYLKQYEE